MKIKVAIVGATGYAGAEIVRLLYNHPNAEVTAVSSVSFEGKQLSEVYPAYKGFCDKVCENQSEVVDKADVVFAALPHGLSEALAKECDEKGKRFIDLGADFRLECEEDYQQWYEKSYDCPELHSKSVYCIPELFRQNVNKDSIIANPGCYPTSISLGLYPALEKGFVETEGIVIDSKSGVTGAGRGLSQTTHYPDCNEAFSPYKVAQHRHTPEIEQSLSHAANEPLKVTFVPHLLPVNRGIVSTMYARLKSGVTEDEVFAAYNKKYENEPFVRVLKKGAVANLKNVKYTNMCDISLHFDKRTNTLIVVSTIDNMVKGAAGQAIQNMNLIFGLPETTGLDLVPPAF
ncbi:MAG: N-acetyl-gamma-glutamyl-phosphate reductase [Clostridia bacterium]|nr:N-acetyl-gamma-glutamyl-phosphate reductase [Clostridia bacterium]